MSVVPTESGLSRPGRSQVVSRAGNSSNRRANHSTAAGAVVVALAAAPTVADLGGTLFSRATSNGSGSSSRLGSSQGGRKVGSKQNLLSDIRHVSWQASSGLQCFTSSAGLGLVRPHICCRAGCWTSPAMTAKHSPPVTTPSQTVSSPGTWLMSAS